MAEQEFLHLRGHCLRVLDTSSRSSVQALDKALEQIDNRLALQQFQEYICLTLFEVLRTRKRTEEVIVDVVKCLKKMLSLTEVNEWKLFSQISFHVVMLLSNREDIESVSVANSSEELKSSVCTCLTELFRRSTESVLESAFGLDFLPQIGHMVYILLQVAENERSQEVRISAMKCLQTLRGPLRPSNGLQILIGDCLANFIPGISITMTKVATGIGLAGQEVTVTALKVWQDLVCVVLSDKQLILVQHDHVQQPKILQDMIPEKGVKRPFKATARNDEWLKNTSDKLAILADKLSQLDSNSNVKVRSALAEWANTLLTECKNSLSIAVPAFISVLITLSCDEFVEVSTFCKCGLANFAETLQDDEKSLVEVLQENLLSLVLDLSRIRNSDDAKKLSTVNKLHGYFTVLGSSLNIVINSATHLEKLSTSLLQLVEMDICDVRMVAERKNNAGYTLEELEALGPQSMPKKFRHFRDEKILDKVYEVCQLFGKFGDLQLLFDHFMDQLHKSTVFRKEAVLLLNYICSGTQYRSADDESSLQEELFQISSYVVEDYINPFVWDLRSSSESKKAVDGDRINNYPSSNLMLIKLSGSQSVAPDSVTQLNSNIIQMCLLLEGLGTLATVLRKKFRPLLIKVLYEVLEKLGNPNVLISQTALMTVSKMAHYCSYSSISDLLLKNSDYLINSVLLKLRFKPTDFKAPRVLCVILQHCDQQMLDIVKDVINEVCLSLDLRPDDRSIPHLRVLLNLVRAITRCHPSQCPPVVAAPLKKPMDEMKQKNFLADFIMEYHRQREFPIDASDLNEAETDEPDDQSFNVKEIGADDVVNEKKQTPKHIQMVIDVLDRCCHHLPSSNLSIRLLILDILDLSFVALQEHTDELLPMVHKVWSPLLQRLCDGDDLLTMKKAFHTLCVVCRLCSDFVRGRVVKEIWPKLIEFLQKHVKIRPTHLNMQALIPILCSAKNDANFSYTVAYKFLLEILLNVGDLVVILNVSELDVDRLASACIFYLSRRQPTAVQEATVNLFEKLATWVPDLIWFKLADLSSEATSYVHECSSLKDVTLGGRCGNEGFSENIAELNRRLEGM